MSDSRDSPTRLTCPLDWPAEWPRHEGRRGPAPYRVDAVIALGQLLEELRLWRCSNVVVTTNLRVNTRDVWYAGESTRVVDDPGVSLFFRRAGEPMVVACDRWDTVRGNLRAIGLLVAGLRSVERTQVGEMMRRAYLGLKALPAAGQVVSARGREWWMDVLGVDCEASFETVRTAYRRMARKYHPDAGGSHGGMSLVNAAWKEAEAHFLRVSMAS